MSASPTPRRTQLVRAVAAAVIVVVTVVGWLLVDPTGTSAPQAGPASASAVRASGAASSAATDPATGLGWVDLAALPAAAQTTVQLIDAGGPFPYAKDGAVFGNREGLLPRQVSGYYREYTVPTPGSADRGARRIVSGDGTRQLFYTDDHYASFRRVRR